MRVHRNCCGLDVHKKIIAACLIKEDADGNSIYEKRLFGSMTRDLHELVRQTQHHSSDPSLGQTPRSTRVHSHPRTPLHCCSKQLEEFSREAITLRIPPAGILIVIEMFRQRLMTSVTQPSGCSIGAVLGQCIEGNRRAWGSLVNSVDDGFEYCKTLGRQAHASSDYHTIVARRT
jgi:hypothetical protein